MFVLRPSRDVLLGKHSAADGNHVADVTIDFGLGPTMQRSNQLALEALYY